MFFIINKFYYQNKNIKMAIAIFAFNGTVISIQCKKEDKLKDICQKFFSKMELNTNKVFFLYSGKLINLESTFKEQANLIDINRNIMNIIVLEKSNNNEGIICPKCGEKLDITFEKEKIDILLNSNSSQNNILIGIKEQIKNIVKDLNINKNIEGIKFQLNNIIFIIEHLIKDIKKIIMNYRN